MFDDPFYRFRCGTISDNQASVVSGAFSLCYSRLLQGICVAFSEIQFISLLECTCLVLGSFQFVKTGVTSTLLGADALVSEGLTVDGKW